eukprot:353050_1
MAKALSISILFLITKLNCQQGYGCPIKTCPIAGQVRTNIVTNAQGQYLSGCECVGEYLSIPYIWTAIEPQTPQIDPQPQQIVPQQIIPQQIIPIEPRRPIGTPITVTCQTETLCQCPPDHIGECKIICKGTQDACKDIPIKCNNGYACTIDCITSNACSSGTIYGPNDASLTVNCEGQTSCETTIFDGASGTDLNVFCNGGTSCKDSSFHFGKGMGNVECNGHPDACIDAKFNLLSGQSGFQCIGSNCPPTPEPFGISPNNIPTSRWTPTPRPVNPTPRPTNPTPAPTVTATVCQTPGNCECPRGAPGCIIECGSSNDACKDSEIKCNDGFPCEVNCITMNSCSGATTIIGPVGASLTVNCKGGVSCEGSFMIDAADSTNTQIICSGNEACKGGNVVFYFGTGINHVACSGQPDSCLDAQFIVPNGAVAFECVGTNCRGEPKNFNNAAQQIPYQPIQPIQIQPIQPVQPQMGGARCCTTSMKSWRGKCWKATTKTECNFIGTKCSWIWDASSCLPNPPMNTFGKVCKLNSEGCNDATDCCSEECMYQTNTGS